MTRNVKKHRYVTKEGLKAYNDKFEAWTKKDSATFAGTSGASLSTGVDEASYDSTNKVFVALPNLNLSPYTIARSRYVFRMNLAVPEDGVRLSVGGCTANVRWQDKPASPTNTWAKDDWVDAWYYGDTWYLTYANTRVSYEIWGEETRIIKPRD